MRGAAMTQWLVEVFQFAMLGWFALMLGVIALQMLTGRMPLYGMLSSVEHGRFDPERVQALAVFLFVLGAYLVEVLGVFHGEPVKPDGAGVAAMPDISGSLLALLTGSNGVYLAGKIARNA